MHIPAASGYFTPQATATIHAPLERVWAILVDSDHYGAWNTFVPSMQTDLQVGSPLIMRVHMRKGLRVKMAVTVSAVDPLQRLAWKTKFPRWFLRSERLQLVTALDAGTTLYWTGESFAGFCAPVLKALLGKDLQRGFEAVAQNLKTHAEAPGEKL